MDISPLILAYILIYSVIIGKGSQIKLALRIIFGEISGKLICGAVVQSGECFTGSQKVGVRSQPPTKQDKSKNFFYEFAFVY